MIIIKTLIVSYIQNLKLEDIENFIKKNQYPIKKQDIETIFKYVKKYGKDILDGDITSLEKIKEEVEPSTYVIIMELYNKYKGFLN